MIQIGSRVTPNGNLECLTVGKTYIVVDVTGFWVDVIRDDGEQDGWAPRFFNEVELSPLTEEDVL